MKGTRSLPTGPLREHQVPLNPGNGNLTKSLWVGLSKMVSSLDWPIRKRSPLWQANSEKNVPLLLQALGWAEGRLDFGYCLHPHGTICMRNLQFILIHLFLHFLIITNPKFLSQVTKERPYRCGIRLSYIVTMTFFNHFSYLQIPQCWCYT